MMNKNKEHHVQAFLRKASMDLLERFACEIHNIRQEDVIDMHDFYTPLNQVDKTFVSIANNAQQKFGFRSRNNKVRTPMGRIEKRICEVISNEAKFESLKEVLRKKGIVSHMAIQQYLLQHDEEGNCRFEHSCTNSRNTKVSLTKLSDECHSHVSIKKERNGYQWNDPFAAPSSSRYENIRIMPTKELE